MYTKALLYILVLPIRQTLSVVLSLPDTGFAIQNSRQKTNGPSVVVPDLTLVLLGFYGIPSMSALHSLKIPRMKESKLWQKMSGT
jgi:hypothetical protein